MSRCLSSKYQTAKWSAWALWCWRGIRQWTDPHQNWIRCILVASLQVHICVCLHAHMLWWIRFYAISLTSLCVIRLGLDHFWTSTKPSSNTPSCWHVAKPVENFWGRIQLSMKIRSDRQCCGSFLNAVPKASATATEASAAWLSMRSRGAPASSFEQL